MRRISAVFAAAVLALLSAGQAAASDPGEQAAANAAASAQSALALAGALQSDPSNANVAVRVLSPGDSGAVSQSNTVVAGSAALNANSTSQSASQAQDATSGPQTAGQIAGNEQAATSTADAAQLGPQNENIDVRVLSPGDGGSVEQSNTVVAGSLAANGNTTSQASDQTQSGGAGSGTGQTVGQAASSQQDAAADADASQKGAQNRNIAVRVLSPGDDGSVTQSNTVAGIAAALNGNSTTQSATQAQSGAGGTQAALQGSKSRQDAASTADAVQYGASNENIAVRVLSPGDGGDVSQSNTVLGLAGAVNKSRTSQSASQTQGTAAPAPVLAPAAYPGKEAPAPKAPAPGVQAVGQIADSAQDARAASDAWQAGATNVNAPVSIGSAGDGGSTTQANTVVSGAVAANGNETAQSADQSQAGAGTLVQAIGQSAASKQFADAEAAALQKGATNANAPVRLFDDGSDGSVVQSNTVAALAAAVNRNETTQSAAQTQAGGTASPAVQAVGQAAKNEQFAAADGQAVQYGASNVNSPIRFGGRFEKGCEPTKYPCEAKPPVEKPGCSDGKPAYDPCEPRKPDYDPCKGKGGYDPCEPRKPDYDPCKGKGGYDPCEPRKPDYDACKGKGGYDPCEPRKPDYDPCKGKGGYDPCEPRKPPYESCEPRKDSCEWKRPVEPRPCDRPKCEWDRCEPRTCCECDGGCERRQRTYWPEKGGCEST